MFGNTWGIVQIYVGIYFIVKGRLIECPSILNMEDVEVTRTLGREGATCY